MCVSMPQQPSSTAGQRSPDQAVEAIHASSKAMIFAARRYLGVPFRHGGRVAQTGLDCAGLIACVLSDLGVPFQDQLAYGLGQDNLGAYERCLRSAFIPCEADQADVVLFRYRSVPCHAAIVGGGRMVHLPYQGICLEEGLSEKWLGRVHSSWRLRSS